MNTIAKSNGFLCSHSYPPDLPLTFEKLPERLEGSAFQPFQQPERKNFTSASRVLMSENMLQMSIASLSFFSWKIFRLEHSVQGHDCGKVC
jgi:hypothetical protein